MSKEQIPAAVRAVQELQSDVHSPEDQLVLDSWKGEVGSLRAKALAEMGSRHNQMDVTVSAGAVAPVAAVEAERALGHDMSDDYSAGAHSN